MARKVPKEANIGSDLWRVLISYKESKDLIDFVRRAMDAKILFTKDEVKICTTLLQQYELTHAVDLNKVMVQCHLYFNLYYTGQLNQYKEEDLLYESEAMIGRRLACKDASRAKAVFDNSNIGYFTKSGVSLFLNNYASVIDMNVDINMDDLLKSFNSKDITKLSSGIDSIDKCFNGGFKDGSVTTILGIDGDIGKNLWSLNIIYNSISNGKNVLVIFPGESEDVLYQRLILRHSYDSRFENELVCDEDGNYDENIVNNVCLDFYDSLSKHLIVMGEDEFDISTVTSLQRLFVVAEHQFNERFESGIDLVIIDNFNNMKLNDGKKMITNKNDIKTQYYSFLRSQCKNLIGTRRIIPIITTCDIEKKYSSYARENDSFQSYFVPDVIDDLSDNILFSRSESGNKMNVVVIKPVRPSMGGYYMLPVVTNFKNWYMSYSNKDTKSNRINEEMACEDSPNEDIIITSTSNMEDTDTLTSSSIPNDFDPFNESDGRKTLEEIKEFMLKNDDEGGKQHE